MRGKIVAGRFCGECGKDLGGSYEDHMRHKKLDSDCARDGRYCIECGTRLPKFKPGQLFIYCPNCGTQSP